MTTFLLCLCLAFMAGVILLIGILVGFIWAIAESTKKNIGASFLLIALPAVGLVAVTVLTDFSIFEAIKQMAEQANVTKEAKRLNEGP